MPGSASFVRRPRWLLAGAVLLLHALIAIEWARLAGRARSTQRSVATVQLRLLPAPARITPPRIEVAPTTPRAERPPARASARRSAPSITLPAAAEPATATAVTAAAPASAAASEPASLLDSAGTRRAIREAARAGIDADTGMATDAQRLSNGMRNAAKGDCMKGEYAGGGMGLLSLPFLAAAVVGGQCAK
ncbi:MAG: hypothetical protein JSR59_20780 [Proteobacteria bacterium]|nr:hypothetical protein [Pseudomonadota bacterium]